MKAIMKRRRESSSLGRVASSVGKGLFAGLIGTAAMTASSTLEVKLRSRGSSDAPAEAAEEVLGVEPESRQKKSRLSNVAHWGYGTLWGAARGLLAAGGMSGAVANATHFAAVWGSEQVLLPLLDVAPPLTSWGLTEIAIDAGHHVVYAAATGAAYEWLDRSG